MPALSLALIRDLVAPAIAATHHLGFCTDLVIAKYLQRVAFHAFFFELGRDLGFELFAALCA